MIDSFLNKEEQTAFFLKYIDFPLKRGFQKIGRNSLVSSHAGTRLPIAVVLSAGYRALPLCPPDAPSGQLPRSGIRQKVFFIILQSKRETSHLEVSQPFHVFFKRPYVGIIQIRLWVEGFSFLSACQTSSPLCLLANFIIYLLPQNGKAFAPPIFLKKNHLTD